MATSQPLARKASKALGSAQETARPKSDALEEELFDLRGEIGPGQESSTSCPKSEWFGRSDAAMARLRDEDAAPPARPKEVETSGGCGGGGGASLRERWHTTSPRSHCRQKIFSLGFSGQVWMCQDRRGVRGVEVE
ncbi:hypothetical protein WOLCODRAFT_154079 [Wolfiporia cocos MD-104 SS10]|uniref:Uncharacterized protein n=1 Tax=Wolfiporia cocos (strain MD-104) TaxID=742152 RepID=A0A2H3JPC6_WOLCO|nr:hypothetical protein WOLCODRAFT_154079 [Wolfiporia cocos MD-104 SS10]